MPGAGKEEDQLGICSFSQISQQFEACISQHRLGYAAVATTTIVTKQTQGNQGKITYGIKPITN